MVRTGEETISVSVTEMDPYGADIYTEVDGDPDTWRIWDRFVRWPEGGRE